MSEYAMKSKTITTTIRYSPQPMTLTLYLKKNTRLYPVSAHRETNSFYSGTVDKISYRLHVAKRNAHPMLFAYVPPPQR